MRKIFYFLMAAVTMMAFAACEPKNPPTDDHGGNEEPSGDEELPTFLDPGKESQMVLFLGGIPVSADTSIVVFEAEENPLTGTKQMGLMGTITCADGFRVSISRSAEGQKDELCAGQQCVPGDGELTQTIDFSMMGEKNASWYTHYTVDQLASYVVVYTFTNYNRSIRLTVDYQNAAL